MKKFVSMFLAAVMCLTIPVFAAEKETHNNQREADLVKTMNNEYIFSAPVTAYPSKDSYSNDTSITVFSPEFEDAYIEVEEYNISDFRVEKFNGKISVSSSNPHTQQFIDEVVMNDEKLLEAIVDDEATIGRLVAATVFVDEEYGYVDGEYIVINSRLLTQEEVAALESAVAEGGQVTSNYKGKLTITFACTPLSDTTKASKYKLTGKATWSGAAFSGVDGPSVGLDFFGFSWSGGFSSSNRTATLSNNDDLGSITLAEAVPNAGVVWSYYEKVRDPSIEDGYVFPVADIYCEISKNTLEGKGNTAEAVLKYIHTYQAATGSISISATADNVGGGFSLSSCEKQWSIVCIADDLDY